MTPQQINDAPVRIQRLLSAPGDADETTGRVVSNKKYGDPEPFYAQLYSFTENRRLIGFTGNISKSLGYLLYKTPKDQAKHLKPGDLIVGLPNRQRPDPCNDDHYRTVNFAVMENPNPEGHGAGPSLWRAFYTENLDKVSGKKART